MKLISHRGNLSGPNKNLENKQNQIEKIISLGFDCEIDVRTQDEELFLGHDSPDFQISFDWLTSLSDNLWIHCKDLKTLSFLSNTNSNLNYFWHDKDSYTITSKGNIWVFPGKPVPVNGVLVLPENIGLMAKDIDSSLYFGVCSDYIRDYL
jgi:hypothetical protein